MITANPADYHPNLLQQHNDNQTVIKRVESTPSHISGIGMHSAEDTTRSTKQSHAQNYNLYTNPYNGIAPSIYLRFVTQSDYLSFSKCLSSITQSKLDNRPRKCLLSQKISFKFRDVIGSGNHGQIFSANIKYNSRSMMPLSVNKTRINAKKYAIKYSYDNETCDVLQFEYNIMKQIQSANNMHLYYLTDLHPIIPYIEWHETNRFTRETERKCILVMEHIENVKTFEGLIQKQFAPSFKIDAGLISFVNKCYNELMVGLQRLHLFNYYHIDINGVNILVHPRHNITVPRTCYLIDYGGVFAMDFDAKTHKTFTGKSHNYSPFAYYNLYEYEQRERTKWNATKLNYFARKDNEYRIIVEIIRMFLEYADLERDSLTENEWEYIEDAKRIQNKIEHITPVGISTYNQSYIQSIWCLRRIMIDDIRNSNLGTKQPQIYNPKQKKQFYKLLDILEDAITETRAINSKLCINII